MNGIDKAMKTPPKTLSALQDLGMLPSERQPDPIDLLRRIVAWRDGVTAGGVIRGADLEALIEEARALALGMHTDGGTSHE